MRADVVAFEALARMLIGVAFDSVQQAAGSVTLPQFRLLLTLNEIGKVPSSRLAAALGSSASSVSRLADKLEALGYLARGKDKHSRSIVTVEVTPDGHRLVNSVLDRRHETLEMVLDRMDPSERRAATVAALHFTELAARLTPAVTGPVPL